MSEIFPTRIREGGIAVGTATQWLWNFAFSQITPHAIENLGWKTFLMFSIFNFALVVYSFLVIKETKGRSLEEMEIRKTSQSISRIERESMLTISSSLQRKAGSERRWKVSRYQRPTRWEEGFRREPLNTYFYGQFTALCFFGHDWVFHVLSEDSISEIFQRPRDTAKHDSNIE